MQTKQVERLCNRYGLSQKDIIKTLRNEIARYRNIDESLVIVQLQFDSLQRDPDNAVVAIVEIKEEPHE